MHLTVVWILFFQSLYMGSLFIGASSTGKTFLYEASFVCGEVPRSQGSLIQGDYRTDFILHNPSGIGMQVEIKIALAFPPGQGLNGELSLPRVFVLPRGRSIEIGCNEIFGIHGEASEFFPSPFPWTDACDGLACDFIKGFIVIASPLEITTRGVFTAGSCRKGLTTAELGNIPFRLIEECFFQCHLDGEDSRYETIDGQKTQQRDTDRRETRIKTPELGGYRI